MRTGIVVIDLCKGYIDACNITQEDFTNFLIDLNYFLHEQAKSTIFFVHDHVGNIESFEKVTSSHYGLRAEQEAQRLMEFAGDRFLIPKDNWDAFSSSNTGFLFSGVGIEEVLLCGLYTEMCILHSAQGAQKMGFKPKVVRNLIISEEGKIGIPNVMENYFKSITII